jgi:DNA repair protein RadC
MINSSLEKVLSCAIGDQKSPEVIEKLTARYGTLMTAFSATTEELCRVGGIKENTALLIKLIAYLNARRITDNFEFGVEHNELELREYIAALFLGASVETVYVLLLDDSDKVIATEYISDGTVNSSDIFPRKILECVKRKGCSRIILAHNHPMGSTSPSKNDIATTGRLFNLFATIGVRLCSHYIVADGEVGLIDSEMLYNPKDLNLR